MVTTSRYEYPFDPDKRNNTASTVFRLVRTGGVRVLDLGSGPGIVAGALARLADKDVTCVDLEDHHLEAAAERGVQRTVRSDLTSNTWTDQLAGEQFDVIILADVLEHLVHPAALLTRIRDHQLLAPGGRLVISIPNASHIAILALLATGDFPYRPAGLLDATHLRFFTLTSIRRMLEEVGFAITRVNRTTKPLRKTEFREVADLLSDETLRHLASQNEETDTYQYVLQAEPLDAKAVATLEKRLRKSEDRRRRLKKRTTELEERNGELERKLDEVYASQTWRAGRWIVAAPAVVRRGLRSRG